MTSQNSTADFSEFQTSITLCQLGHPLQDLAYVIARLPHSVTNMYVTAKTPGQARPVRHLGIVEAARQPSESLQKMLFTMLYHLDT